MAKCQLASDPPMDQGLAALIVWVSQLRKAHPDDAWVIAAAAPLRMIGSGVADAEFRRSASMAIVKVRESFPESPPPVDPEKVLAG